MRNPSNFRFSFAYGMVLLLAMASGGTAQAQVALELSAGWNLLGNSSAASIDAATSFAEAANITTVWKWNKTANRWAIYAPSMSSAALASYAQTKGYEVLAAIGPKEGFWVNAASAGTLSGPVAAGVMLAEGDLQLGWNLMGSADGKSASQLNQGLSGGLNAAGKAIVTAWAWDVSKMQWKFFAPALEAQGGTALSDYIGSKGYLPFGAALSAAEGYWLNVGAAVVPPPVQVAPDMSAVAASMTLDQRRVVLDKVAVFWRANKTGNRDTDNDALASFIRAQPEFESAGVSPDQAVWARFKDGRSVIWHYPKFVLDGAGTSAPAALSSAEQGDIPKGTKAVLLDAFQGKPGLAFPIADVAAWLDAAGYASEQLPTVAVNQLMTRVQDVGMLWITAHGAFALALDGTISFILLSNDSYVTPGMSFEEFSAVEQMYNEGLLILTSNLSQDMDNKWGITEKFVKKFWTFKSDSLIVMNSCSLFNVAPAGIFDGTEGQIAFGLPGSAAAAAAQNVAFQAVAAAAGESFRGTLAAKSAGKTTIIGWDKDVSVAFAQVTIPLFFDRVLGANQVSPENPPQRPFSYKAVYDWMVAKGKVLDPGPKFTATMKLETRGTPEGQLVPSLGWASVYPGGTGGLYTGEWILDLAGDFFGPDLGTVTVNGTQLLVHTWSDTNVIARLPDSLDSPGASGDIVVEVQGRKSNVVPLTQWTGTVKQSMVGTEIGSGARADVTCPVHATGDVHYKRFAPGDPTMLASPLFIELTAKCTYTLSGTWSDDATNYELSGSGTLGLAAGEKTAGSLYCCAAGPSTVPVDFTAVLITPHELTAGTLKAIDRTDGKASYAPVTQYSWSVYSAMGNVPGVTPAAGVTLGADYSFRAVRSCAGPDGTFPTTCSETWDMTPAIDTAPTPATKS